MRPENYDKYSVLSVGYVFVVNVKAISVQLTVGGNFVAS